MTSGSGSIVLVGAGNMGGAMLSGWLDKGVSGDRITVVDPSPSDRMKAKIVEAGARHVTAVPEGFKADILFLAVKPQMMDVVLPPLRPVVGDQTVIVSVAAGKTLVYLKSHLDDAAMVRAMPNTPAMIGRGVTGAFANARVSDVQREAVDALLRVSGPVEWVATESDIDAVTAVSGSGPAYVFYLVECMAEAGRKLGLPADLAMRLARETVSGAGELLNQSPEDASQLRKNVTSPGGTTAAALSVLMADDGIQPIFDKAIAAARTRAEELGN
ncbi:pyrroline-5-carboxylate reductase [Aliirhizobium smilacinae]|uniref:Pyrroline-5-carboxylate reductase n=1 Tax=Aliirhizobium smilacinae TaxID=1395944 RepID=A0A5C4XKH4_9HYPH|nr:pyrroline-5-carboxylate reductase [Rhizobium smilacinae]